MHPRTSPGRTIGGFAIVMAAAVLLVLLAVATSLTSVTIGTMRMARDRQADGNLTVSAESVANIGFNHLQNLPTLSSELALAKTRAATDPAADLSAAIRSTAPTYANRATLNGADERTTWKYLGSMSVPILGVNQSQDLYQLTTTAAMGGPARYYNADGTTNPVSDIEHYRRRRVEAVFTQFPSNIYRQAMFARNGYSFMGSATTDSWSSNGGLVPYAGAPTGAHGDLSSNGDIVVQKPGAVQGAVKPHINMPVPPITYNPPSSAILLPGPSIGTYTKSTGSGLASGIYHCSAIDLASNNSIKIPSGAKVDIYVDGPLLLTNDWIIPPDAVVRIFQDNYDPALGVTTINGNITVGCPQNPSAFQIYSLYDGTLGGNAASPVAMDLKMNGNAQLGAVFMAPYATFKLNGTFDWYGSVLANAFFDSTGSGKVNGNFKFHYDESLSSLTLPFPPTLVVVGWRAYNLGFAQWRSTGVMWDDP